MAENVSCDRHISLSTDERGANVACHAGTVSASEVSRTFDLTAPQTEAVLEVLAALSLSNNLPQASNATSSPQHGGGGAESSPMQVSPMPQPSPMQQQPPPVSPVGQERIFMHELSMFLLAQVNGGQSVTDGCRLFGCPCSFSPR